MAVTIHVPGPDTAARRRTAMEAPGRPWNRVAGGWLADLVGLRKFITLCPFCDAKFHPRKAEYELWRRDQYVVARCDGCNELYANCKAFIHESVHDAIGDTRRHRGRWAR